MTPQGNIPQKYIWEFAGNPANANLSIINPPKGALVINNLNGDVYRKTTGYGDNSGFSKLQSVGYNVYTAILTISTGVVAANVLQNTLGGTVVWSNAGTGIYHGTLAGAFTANKTWANFPLTAGIVTVDGTVAVSFISEDVVRLDTDDVDGNNQDMEVDNVCLEIRVYS